MTLRPSALRPLLAVAALVLLDGCRSTMRFPSLAPRPIEAIARQPERVTSTALAATDPALEVKVTALAELLRTDRAAWARTMDITRRSVATARGTRMGEERWILAQQAISRLDALRQDVAAHVEQVDRLRFEQAQSATPADRTTLDALWATATDQIAAQDRAAAEIAAALPAG